LIASWRRVRANKGTSGIDGETIEMIEAEGISKLLNEIRDELKAKKYQPTAVRRVWIPKSDGKQRPLGIPTVKDRVVQMAAKMIIEPIFEADFEEVSYGFRPNKNAHQAVAEVKKYLNWGLVKVVDADISSFFDNISHKKLLQLISKKIVDKNILKLIKMWLESGIMEEGNIRKSSTGTPQGGVISPLLANVYLNEVDKYWKLLKYGKRGGWNAQIIRYADDIMIFTDKDPEKPLKSLKAKLGRMELELNSKKTKVLSADEGNFDFLGFNFRKSWNKTRTKKFPLMIPSHKAVLSIKARIRYITQPRPVKVGQVVKEINPVMRGWINYFRIGNSSKTFHKVQQFMVKRVRRFIRRNQGKDGYGWKKYPNSFLYGNLGLIYDQQVTRIITC
jgi:group II intron reverse transcriptase/maturase